MFKNLMLAFKKLMLASCVLTFAATPLSAMAQSPANPVSNVWNTLKAPFTGEYQRPGTVRIINQSGSEIQKIAIGFNGRTFVDSSPLESGSQIYLSVANLAEVVDGPGHATMQVYSPNFGWSSPVPLDLSDPNSTIAHVFTEGNY